jgi:hypothetical protein
VRILIPWLPFALRAELVRNLDPIPKAIGACFELGDENALHIDLWDRTLVFWLQVTPSPPKR